MSGAGHIAGAAAEPRYPDLAGTGRRPGTLEMPYRGIRPARTTVVLAQLVGLHDVTSGAAPWAKLIPLPYQSDLTM